MPVPRARILERADAYLPILGIVLAAAALSTSFSLQASNWAVMRSAIFMSTSPKTSTVRDLNSA